MINSEDWEKWKLEGKGLRERLEESQKKLVEEAKAHAEALETEKRQFSEIESKLRTYEKSKNQLQSGFQLRSY